MKPLQVKELSVGIVLIICMIFHFASTEVNNQCFPEDFLFGIATSSYQTEGAWNEGGRAVSIWDFGLHNNPNLVIDQTDGDIACNSYHKWEEDVQLIKNLGVNFYRFSISWSRILPLGYKYTEINEEGVKYYNDLIDALLAEGIQPYITIYHWDLPQTLQNKGGWLNETVNEDYVYYAKVLFKLYGDRVKHWITFNEFYEFCEGGYSSGSRAPFLKMPGVGGYECGHNTLLAHGRIYRLYEKEFKPTQGGQVGVTVSTSWCDPLMPDSESDQAAAEQYMQFNYGWFVHPIVIGNYPPIMIERINVLSKQQGYEKSRLPEFTSEQIEMVRGSFDFLGLNHYSAFLCTFSDNFSQPSFESDCGVRRSQKSSWKPSAASWIKYTPWGFRKLLVWIKQQLDNPPVLVTENGWANSGVDLDDFDRIHYMKGYLSEMLKAMYEDGCNVIGYAPWSMMDNFEWTFGYTLKFGLVHVDFDSPNRTRTPRSSFRVFQEIISSKQIT